MNKSQAGKLGHLAGQKKRDENKQKRLDSYNESPKICTECNDVLSYEKRYNKFCNSSCATKASNKLRSLKGNYKTKEIKCRICNNKAVKKLAHCNDCINKKLHTIKAFVFSEIKSDTARRRFLLRNRSHKCQLCGITKWNNKPCPLIMDHIDGNSDNNVEENLRLICPNCDAQLPTFKGANKGSGRKCRTERYLKDKKENLEKILEIKKLEEEVNNAAIAQLVELSPCNAEVVGSNPTCSSNVTNKL